MATEANKIFDHTLLKADAAKDKYKSLCDDAKKYSKFIKAVCVPQHYVDYCKELLAGSDVLVATVVGFPLGYVPTEAKMFEVKNTKADEIDMVMNISAMKSGDYAYVEKDIGSVVKAADGRPVKVIGEMCYLTEEEKKLFCEFVKYSGAAYAKTSTGFGPSGATVDDVKLIKAYGLKAKAAGGINADNIEEFLKVLEKDDRIGSSSTVNIIEKRLLK